MTFTSIHLKSSCGFFFSLPRITHEENYRAAREKIMRLGLSPLFEELKTTLQGFKLFVKEERDANGGAAVRKMIDQAFEKSKGWTKRQSGDVDWTKCHVINGTRVCIGVEVQFSGRSDLIVVDVIHLRRAITSGLVDVGILVVPSNRLGPYLVDRGPRLDDAKRLVKETRAEDLPLLVLALEHDGPGPPLPKQAKRKKVLKKVKKQ